MIDILHHLARCYLRSAHGRKPTTRDFTIDYEKFLRAADAADGDAREIAERALRDAERKSNGALRVDRNPRSGIPERLRLSEDGGEAWLFRQLDSPTPTCRRETLAASFREMALLPAPEPWRKTWSGWFHLLAQSAFEGSSVQPFLRDDPRGNETLTRIILGVMNWQGPSLIRYASTAICGDSKQLQKLEPRLRLALAAITGSDALEDFGILRKPRTVTFHGPLTIRIDSCETDFSMFPGPVALSETNFPHNSRISTTATLCLTVENEDTFHELAATNPGVILILTSYAGAAVRRLMDLLPSHLRFLHFGDGDPAGSDILRDLRHKSGRDIHPLLIPGQESIKRRSLTDTDRSTLERLLESDLPATLHAHVKTMLESGMPVDFEQEGIPIHNVWEMLSEEQNRL